MECVEDLEVLVGDGRQGEPSGGVHDDVDAAVVGLDPVEHRGDGVLVGDVGLDGEGVPAGGFDLRDGGGCGVRAAGVVHDDGEAVGGESGRDRAADAAGSASDHGDALGCGAHGASFHWYASIISTLRRR